MRTFESDMEKNPPDRLEQNPLLQMWEAWPGIQLGTETSMVTVGVL